jgi:subtilisin family serine protease
LPGIEYAEKNIILHPCTEPNDEWFKLLWGLHNEGRQDQGGGTADADIDAPEAWDIFTGSEDIVVAVIDTGVDYDHIDLAANIWTNPGEMGLDSEGNPKKSNGVDDDENEYTDDWRGWDFYYDDNDPMDNCFACPYHGTHIAGILGAVGNNDEGVTGVNWNVKIMALKISNTTGDMPVTDAIAAIDYATKNGAHLTNNSYGYYEDDPDLVENYQSFYAAIRRARDYGNDEGKLFIAGAGNYHWSHPERDNDISPYYPASFDLANIISVAATDHNDNLPFYSHYGFNSVDLGAPGGHGGTWDNNDIYSTSRTTPYIYMAGTSQASPHVAGVAALVLGKCPLLKYDHVKNRLMDNVDLLSSLSGKTVTGGRLNAYKAIYDPSPPPAAPSNLDATATAYNQIDLSWQDNSDNELVFEIHRKKAGDNDFLPINSTRENVTSFQDKTCSIGTTYHYKVRASRLAGNSSFSNTVIETIPAEPPEAPSFLRAIAKFTTVNLRWYDNSSNEQVFKIERKKYPYTVWEEIDWVEPNIRKYKDTGLPCNETVYYRVRAYNEYGHSPYSNVAVTDTFCFYCKIRFEPKIIPDKGIISSREYDMLYD